MQLTEDNPLSIEEDVMIWLSSAQGTGERSIYFDIRNIDLVWHERRPCGSIRGVIGDGCSEIWGDIQLGQEDSAQLLPVWHDNGVVETLSADLDGELLAQQLLVATRDFLEEKGLLQGIAWGRDRVHTGSETSPKSDQLAA
jgi:hypothetical protein